MNTNSTPQPAGDAATAQIAAVDRFMSKWDWLILSRCRQDFRDDLHGVINALTAQSSDETARAIQAGKGALSSQDDHTVVDCPKCGTCVAFSKKDASSAIAYRDLHAEVVRLRAALAGSQATQWTPLLTQAQLHEALIALMGRIEACGASPELTWAVTLAGDIRGAIGNQWNKPDSYAVQRVLAAPDLRADVLQAAGSQEEVVGVPASFANQFSDLNPATLFLVWNFAVALADKLTKAEKKYGYTDGWRDPGWMDECRAKLVEHIAKGDPRDVAAYCAFLWHHGESTATTPGAAAPDGDDRKCETCNGAGWLGGPSFAQPDEGGVECPDCGLSNHSATDGDIGALLEQLRSELKGDKGWDYTEYEKGRIAEKERTIALLAALSKPRQSEAVAVVCMKPREYYGHAQFVELQVQVKPGTELPIGTKLYTRPQAAAPEGVGNGT